MRLYSYIVARDYGFAPNPFGVCTLATCKPAIRKHCEVDDWVMGTGSCQERRQGHLVYIMRVSEIMSFDEYWKDPRFLQKRPNLRGSIKQAYGDNIYHRSSQDAPWQQLPSHHSLPDGRINPANAVPDTKVNRVLIANKFIYWGTHAPKIPSEFRQPEDVCAPTQGHKCRFPPSIVTSFLEWVFSCMTPWGFRGAPHRWETGG